MDDLDRLYRRLIHNIRASRPEYLQIPFTVQELYEQLVPYRHNRRELAIETNQDYETAVARLLAGERGYGRTEPGIQEALQRELSSPTGDPGIFKEHAQGQISLGPIVEGMTTPVPPTMATPAVAFPAVSSATANTESSIESTPASTTAPTPASATPMPPTSSASLLSSFSNMAVPTGCRFCGGTLPEGRDAHYCPHCGENLKTRRCPACGAEMDAAWSFCVTCGRRAG